MDDETEEEGASSAGVGPDLLKSYLAFFKRAVLARRLMASGILFVGTCLTVAVTMLWPRSYSCDMKLSAQRVQAFHNEASSAGMSGASDIIMRQDNLDAIIKKADLVKLWWERRPPLLHFKDVVMAKLHGHGEDLKTTEDSLRWTLRQKLHVDNTDNDLMLSVDWPDAQTAALILETVEQGFLETRHRQDISDVAEYISILEEHAGTLRNEVQTIARQMSDLQEHQLADAKKKFESQLAEQTIAPPRPARVERPASEMFGSTHARAEPSEDLTLLKQALEDKKKTLASLRDIRKNRVQDLQTKLAEFETTYTDAHPLVLETKANIQKFSQEPAEESALRQDIAATEDQLKNATAASQTAAVANAAGIGRPSTSSSDSSAAGPAEALPKEIVSLMQQRSANVDPAVQAQFLYAVGRYTELRNSISSARIDLDTAQAAFNHRYKVVTPPEVPSKPTKPKVPVLLGGGIFLSLLLSVAIPFLAELRRGKIVELWQVQSLALPILGDLRFPPHSD